MSKCYEILNKKTYKKYCVRSVPLDSKFIFINSKNENNNKIFEGNLLEEQCSICYENIYDFESKSKLGCGHYFHRKCIEKWISNTSTNSCPMCRKEFEYTNLDYKTQNISYLNMNYKFNVKQIKINFDNEDYWFDTGDLHKLYNQCPIEWKSSYEKVTVLNKRSNYLEPIFKLGNFKISTWLRANILFSGLNELNTIKCETKKGCYYDVNINNFKDNKLEYSIFKIIYNWVFNLMHQLNNDKKIVYSLNKNTKILNLLFNYVSKKGLNENEYILMVGSIIYLVNDKKIDLDEVRKILNGEITIEELRDFIIKVDDVSQ